MAVDRVGAYRANTTLERCFSIMIQPCLVEVGIGRVSNQTRETLTLASFRRKKRKKQEPWVPRGVKHKLSWLQPEDSRVNGQDEPASVELRVASGTDISKRQQLPVSWWLWTAWMLMMARLLILESYSLSNRTSTPVTTLWSLVLPSSERWSPSELRRRAEGWLLRNDQTFNEHGWSVTQWGEVTRHPRFFSIVIVVGTVGKLFPRLDATIKTPWKSRMLPRRAAPSWRIFSGSQMHLL